MEAPNRFLEMAAAPVRVVAAPEAFPHTLAHRDVFLVSCARHLLTVFDEVLVACQRVVRECA